jgi:hypothetical protein
MASIYQGDSMDRVKQVLIDVIGDAIGKDGVDINIYLDPETMRLVFKLKVRRYSQVFATKVSLPHLTLLQSGGVSDVISAAAEELVFEMQRAFKEHLKNRGLR